MGRAQKTGGLMGRNGDPLDSSAEDPKLPQYRMDDNNGTIAITQQAPVDLARFSAPAQSLLEPLHRGEYEHHRHEREKQPYQYPDQIASPFHPR